MRWASRCGRVGRARAKLGWTVVGVWADEAPGTSIDRSGLASLVAAIEAGEADAVLALRPDRLSRDVDLARQAEDHLRQAGAEIDYVEDYDVRPQLAVPHVVRRQRRRVKSTEGRA